MGDTIEQGGCLKCGGNLYRGWHTNYPGESAGRDADEAICIMTGALRRQLVAQAERLKQAKDKDTRLRNALADSVERETRIQLRCHEWYEQWQATMGEHVPELPHEKGIWDVGKALFEGLPIEDLPKLPVEQMAEEAIRAGNELRSKAKRCDQAEALIRKAAELAGHELTGRTIDEQQIRDVANLIIRDEHLITWNTTDEREAARLDCAIRDDQIKTQAKRITDLEKVVKALDQPEDEYPERSMLHTLEMAANYLRGTRGEFQTGLALRIEHYVGALKAILATLDQKGTDGG